MSESLSSSIVKNFEEFQVLLETKPGSEAILRVLIEIEEAVEQICVKKQKENTKSLDDYFVEQRDKVVKRILQLLLSEKAESIDVYLESVIRRLDEVLQKSEEEDLFNELGIPHTKIEETILPPQAIASQRTEACDKNQEKRERTGKLLPQLILVLRDLGIYTDQIFAIEGTNSSEMRREESYILVHLPTIGRSVLLCEAYGQATFVCKELVSLNVAKEFDKKQIQSNFVSKRIKYNSIDHWRTEIVEALSRDIEDRRHSFVNSEKSAEQTLFINEIKSEFPKPEHWMGLTAKEKKFVKVYGRGIRAIATILGASGDVLSVRSAQADLGRKIYGEGHDIIECEFWSGERWGTEIKKAYPTPEELISLSADEKLVLKFQGKGLTAIAGILGSGGLPHNNLLDCARLAQKIYGEGHEIVECEFWGKDKWKDVIKEKYPTPESWMQLTVAQRNTLEFYGRGLRVIATIFGNVEGNPIGRKQDHALLGQGIYGKNHDVINCEFWDRDKWRKTIKERYPTPEIWMALTPKDKSQLNFYGKGFVTLASLLGVEEKINSARPGWAKIGRAIYGEGHDIIDCELWGLEKWREIIKEQYPTLESWMQLTQQEKKKLKFYGKGLSSIATIFGFPKLQPASKKDHYAILAQVIYGWDGDEGIELRLNSY